MILVERVIFRDIRKMSKFILGTKIEMTQRFAPDGTVTPVTLLKAGPCMITQVKDKDKDKRDE